MKSVLLHIQEDDAQDSRLEAAVDVVNAFGGHLTCLQSTPFDAFVIGDPFGQLYPVPALLQKLQESEAAHRRRIEERLTREGLSWDWVHCDGPAAERLVERSRLADLIVVSTPPASRTPGSQLDVAADVALHSRAPVLAVPAEQKGFDCTAPALVAWNGSYEAAHALRLSLPLLARSSAINIVTVVEEGNGFPATDASIYLSRHGLASELHPWKREDRTVAQSLLDAAAVLDVGYVVLGAYGHWRIREQVLGGTTRDLLKISELPLVLAH